MNARAEFPIAGNIDRNLKSTGNYDRNIDLCKKLEGVNNRTKCSNRIPKIKDMCSKDKRRKCLNYDIKI